MSHDAAAATLRVESASRAGVGEGSAAAGPARSRRGGTGGSGGKAGKPERPCRLDGCPNPAKRNRLICSTHLRRMEKYGTYTPTPDQFGAPGRRTQQEVGYSGQHTRLRRALGPAKDHPCTMCGQQAREWAYKGGHPTERVGHHGESVMAYALTLDAYMPLCRPCHVTHDRRDTDAQPTT